MQEPDYLRSYGLPIEKQSTVSGWLGGIVANHHIHI